ncbi:MAG: Transcription factor WhiB [Actinomycetota bacterium]|jgi:hypothetical protein
MKSKKALTEEQILKYSLRIPDAILNNAACANTDPKIMDGEDLDCIMKAREVCAGCPALAKCKEWAVWHEPAGVWAGMTPGERAPLRKGEPMIDIVETLRIASYEVNLFSGKTVPVLAAEYGVTQRTIYRWRAELTRLREAS